MDSLDRRIIVLLKEDARRGYTDMAKVLGLSEGAVRQRVKRLVQTGVIRSFTVETAEQYPRAIVFVSASPNIPTGRVAEKIVNIEGVESVFEVAGQYDISVVVSGEDVSAVNRSIDSIREVEGVQGTNTFFVLRRWK
jgi:DNA-binding Lrp family transcriptional regulator